MRGLIFLLLMILQACRADVKVDATQDRCWPRGCSGELEPADQLPSGYSLSDAKILKLEYRRESHSLVAQLEYSDCDRTKHTLSDSICTLSYPSQCSVKLIRPAGKSVRCSTIINEELIYALPEEFTIGSYLVQAKDSSQTVFVDKVGKGLPPVDQ